MFKRDLIEFKLSDLFPNKVLSTKEINPSKADDDFNSDTLFSTISVICSYNLWILLFSNNSTSFDSNPFFAVCTDKEKILPIILSEQPNQGQTVIEKFELHSEVGFAVVLLTADDLGRVKTSEEDKYRARQNVIIEMGYFIGKLGRRNVFPMYEDGVELPSDLHGILYNPIDDAKTWKFKLVKELTAAGYQVDANKIL